MKTHENFLRTPLAVATMKCAKLIKPIEHRSSRPWPRMALKLED